jgi:hypothetical protein
MMRDSGSSARYSSRGVWQGWERAECSLVVDARAKQREPWGDTIPDVDSRLELRIQEFDRQGSPLDMLTNCGSNRHEVIVVLQML